MSKSYDLEADYNRGYDDGVEYVLELMDNYINALMVKGYDGEIRACENLLEEIREIIDEQ
jgi:hypothetical protein